MINTECHSSSSNTNNSSGSNIENVSDPLTQLLSLPVSFSVDPLMTSSSVSTVTTVEATTMASSICSPNATNMSRKRSISPCQSTRMKKDTTNSVVTLKKSRVTLDDKDQKTKERILRNRAAAQESRDKKRRYIAELESNNQRLLHENDVMNKRLRMLEEQNALLQSQLDTFARQLTNIQAVQQLQQQQPAMNDTTTTTTTTTTSLNAHNSKFNAISPILFNDFCDSARIAKKEGLSNSEVVNQNCSDLQRTTTVTEKPEDLVLLTAPFINASKLPSPMLSPSFSSEDEETVYSPNTMVKQDFQLLDDLFDWDGQQAVNNNIRTTTSSASTASTSPAVDYGSFLC